MSAFDPAAARAYLDVGARFIRVGTDVALLGRGSEALARTYGPGTDVQIPTAGGSADRPPAPASTRGNAAPASY